MTAAWRIGAVVLLVAVAVAIYPSARAAYVRHRVTAHLAQADALRAEMSSPVAQQAISGASAQLRFAAMRTGSTPDELARFDAALVDLMAALKSSPPPDNPVSSVTTYEPVARAGAVFPVTVSVRASVPETYLVSVAAEFTVAGGWKSGAILRTIDRPITDAPIDALFEFSLPPDAAGQGSVRTVVRYRLSRTGEGEDLYEHTRVPLPAVAIHR